MKLKKFIPWVLGLALMVVSCTPANEPKDNQTDDTTAQPADTVEQEPQAEYVQLKLYSGCGYDAATDDSELTRASWGDAVGSGNLTLQWDAVDFDSYKTEQLSLIVTDGATPLVGRSSGEADAVYVESTCSGMAVTPWDELHADFQTVNYYNAEELQSAAYCYAVAGDALVTEDTVSGQHIFEMAMPSSFTQTATQEPSFLGDYMYMYAATPYKEGRTVLNFTHVPATFRFVITNLKASEVSLQEVSFNLAEGAEAEGAVVGSKTAELTVDWAEGVDVAFGQEGYGKVAVAIDGATLAQNNNYTAYAMAMPLASNEAFKDKTLNFNIKSDDAEQLAFQLKGSDLAAINGSDIYNWVGGKSYTIRITIKEDGKATGQILDGNIIEVSSSIAGTYTLMYEGVDGLPLENYSAICTIPVNEIANYEDFINVNVAPREAQTIGIYKTTGERMGTIHIAALRPDYTEQPLYSFGLLSDVHIGRSSIDPETDFSNALTFFTNEGATMTCICGDITQDGTEAQFKRYSEIASMSEIPVYTTTGNHDCTTGGINLELWKTYTGYPLVFEKSVENNGKTDHFLFFGMSVWNFSNAYTSQSFTWLEEKLEEYRNERCFIFTHLFFPDRAGNLNNIYPSGNWLSGGQLTRLKKLCDHYTNTLWFSGHSHWEWQLQKYQDRANIYRKLENGQPVSGWCVHVPSCGVPITSNGSSRVDNGASSEGALLQVYENHVDILGANLKKGMYLPIAVYRLDTTPTEIAAKEEEGGSGTPVTPTPSQGSYITADDFTYNTEKVEGATVADVEGMPNYVDVTFTKKGQGFWVTNDTFGPGASSVSITVEDVKATSNGVEIDVPANLGFYGGSNYYMCSTDNAVLYSQGVQFQTSNSKYTGTLPITIRMKVKMVFE